MLRALQTSANNGLPSPIRIDSDDRRYPSPRGHSRRQIDRLFAYALRNALVRRSNSRDSVHNATRYRGRIPATRRLVIASGASCFMPGDRNGTASRVGDESRHQPRDRIALRFVGLEHPDAEAAATLARHRNLCPDELNLDARKIDGVMRVWSRIRSGNGRYCETQWVS